MSEDKQNFSREEFFRRLNEIPPEILKEILDRIGERSKHAEVVNAGS